MTRFIIAFLLLAFHFPLRAQVTDIPCSAGEFYELEGTDIRKLQLTGTTLTNVGIVASITGVNTAGLVYGNDIINNTSHRTFYVSSYNFITNVHVIYEYDGTNWDSIATDNIVYHNGAAFGPFVYFQHSKTPNIPNDQCISRLNPNGSLTKIFTDTTLDFTVADIIVDNQGHVYFFRGPSIGNTTELVEIDPSGNIVGTWSTNLNNLGTLWGAALINNIFYVAWNTANMQLFPLMLTTGTATLGTPISWPVSGSGKDLANCYELESSSVNETDLNNAIHFYPNPSADGQFTLKNAKEGMELIITGIKGELIYKDKISSKGNFTFHIDVPGVYIASLKEEGKLTSYKIVRL